jgi:hypothetical protein
MDVIQPLKIIVAISIGILVAVATAGIVKTRLPIGPPCVVGIGVGALSAMGLLGIGKGMFALILIPYATLGLALLAVCIQRLVCRCGKRQPTTANLPCRPWLEANGHISQFHQEKLHEPHK